jgi:hypothetical protein
MTGEIGNWDALESQCPGRKQMKTTIPGKIINSSGCLKEHDRRTVGLWFFTENSSRHSRNFNIIESADQPAFDALREEFLEHSPPILSANFSVETHFFS